MVLLPLLLAVDDPLVRAGLVALLSDDLVLVGVVGRDADLARVVTELNAEVVLVDASDEPLPSLVELTVPVVALVRNSAGAAAAAAAGAKTVLSRDVDARRLTAALQGAGAGLWGMDDRFDAPWVKPIQLQEPGIEPLTRREDEVLALLAEGRSNREIALALEISVHTAKFHVDRILAKLDGTSRTDAVVRAVRLGLLSL